MWPRKRLDIGWSDLAFAAAACLRPSDVRELAARIEARWSRERGALVCLSVRTGFDLLLTALDWRRGSEILVSALTIPDMVRIIEAHGLVAVPVDLEPVAAAPTADSFCRACSPRTRGLLVAHLFGGRTSLAPVMELARARGLFVFEDCAQAFAGDGWTGTAEADASLFSFGTIKTATALGGAIVLVRDADLLARIRVLDTARPGRSRWAFFERVLQSAALKTLSGPRAFGAIVRFCRLVGLDFDRRLNLAVRGFAGARFPDAIRRRPSAPLLALLERRLSQDHRPRVAARRRVGEDLAARLQPFVSCPGTENSDHARWVFPIAVEEPAATIESLRHAGFDATQGLSLCVVPAPAGRAALDPRWTHQLFTGIVFIPCYADLPPEEIDRLADAVTRANCGHAPAAEDLANPRDDCS